MSTIGIALVVAHALALPARGVASDPHGEPASRATAAADSGPERAEAATRDTPAHSATGGLREEIEVVPPRRPDGGDDAVARSTRLTPDDLARSPSPRLDDALRQAVSFDLFRRSSSRTAHPTTRGVTLRGIGPSGASRALVLLDGLPLNDPFGGWVNFGRVPSTALASVTITPGGGSDTRGDGALAGIVTLTTRPPEERRRVGALTIGERGERRAAVGFGGAVGRVAASIDVERIEADGHPVVRLDRRGPIDGPAPSETAALLARAAVRMGRSSRVLVAFEGFDEERGSGTPLTGATSEGGRLSLAWTSLGRHGRWDASLFGESRDFATRFSSQAADRRAETPALDQFDVPAESAGASVAWTGRADGGGWSAGADARLVDAETNEDFRWVDDAGGARFTRRRSAGARASHAGAWVAHGAALSARWRLEASLRADAWRTSSGSRVEADLDSGTAIGVRRPPDRSASAVSPRLGASFAVADGLRVSGSAYGAFRAPTVNELYRPFRVRSDVTEANDALDPERLRGIEAAVEVATPSVTARAGAFLNRVEDLIANGVVGTGPGTVGPCAFVPAGGLCRQRTNLGAARFAGVEADVRASFAGRWTARAGLLVVDATLVEAPGRPGVIGRPVPQVPASRATASVEYDAPGLAELAVMWRGESGRVEDETGARRLAGHGIFDVLAARTIRPGLRVSVAVGNLFGQEVETARTADGVVSVGAPRLVSVTLAFDAAGRPGRP